MSQSPSLSSFYREVSWKAVKKFLMYFLPLNVFVSTTGINSEILKLFLVDIDDEIAPARVKRRIMPTINALHNNNSMYLGYRIIRVLRFIFKRVTSSQFLPLDLHSHKSIVLSSAAQNLPRPHRQISRLLRVQPPSLRTDTHPHPSLRQLRGL